MSNVLKMAAVGGAVSAETDANFNQTVLLLHGDGTNGAQNNTFLDGSTNNFTITRNGNTTQGTFSPFSVGAGEWSNYFDGTGDYLTVPDNAVFDFNAAFTIEGWLYLNASSNVALIDTRSIGPDGYTLVLTTGELQVVKAGSQVLITTAKIALNSWTHFAVVRDASNNISVFLNGSRDGTTTNSGTWDSVNTLHIGAKSYSSSSLVPINGYISNLRIVKGSAVYDPTQTTITVPTSPLTAITNTSLLTCQSNRFVDNSTNNFAITRNGDVRIPPFSPFAPTIAYTPSVNGGSGYFDGTGDYLSIGDDAALRFGTGNFTIQAWVYRRTLTNFGIASKGASTTGWSFNIGASDTLVFSYASSNITASTVVPLNTWIHVAVVREGTGTNQTKIYFNGVQDGQGTVSTNFTQTDPLFIGANRGASNVFNGYISGFKINVGTAETISVPTAPPTDGTVLLNFTNAGIFDNTGKNNLETVGNAQIDTTTKKYGTGSMEFDGTGDYVQSAPGNPDFNFGTGDFTIEFWMYANATTNGVGGFSTTGTVSGATSLQNDIAFVSNNLRFRVMTGSTITTVASPSVSTSTWTHFALVRNGSTFTVYKDGVSAGTATNSAALNFNTAWVWRIGLGVGSSGTAFNGLIDDFRITKGVARYTANFTAPTKAFPDQ